MTTATEDTNTDTPAENTAVEEFPNDSDELYEQAQIVEDYDDPDDDTTPSGEVSEGDTPTPEETEDQVAEEEDSREPEQPQFGEDLLIAARNAGLPETVAKSFGTPDNLRAFLVSRTPEQPQMSTVASTTDETPIPKFDHGLTDEVVGEEVIQAFDKLGEHVNEQLKRMEQTLQPLRAIEGDVRQQREQAATQAFDAAVDGLGNEELFGKGHQSPGSDGHKARSQVAKARNRILAGCQALGETPPDEQALVNQAYALAYNNRLTQDARTQVTAKVQKRSKQVLARPQSRNGQQLNPLDQAVQRMHTAKQAMLAENATGYADEDEE
jgi:DnaJ-domain-containing protein 1